MSFLATTPPRILPASPNQVRTTLILVVPELVITDLSFQIQSIPSLNLISRDVPAYFDEAIIACGQPDLSKHYFVDDNPKNIIAAHALTWGNCVLYDEFDTETEKLGGLEKVEDKKGKVSVVNNILRELISWVTTTPFFFFCSPLVKISLTCSRTGRLEICLARNFPA